MIRYTLFMSLGEAKQRWDPVRHLTEHFPGVRVEYALLPGRLQGCLERARGIIWLSARLSPVEHRTVLAYELGLLQQGPTPEDPCMAAAHERAALDWAARMLIDGDEFVGAFMVACDYREVAAMLEVDVPTVRARLRGLTDGEQDGVFAAILRQRLSA